MSDKSFEEQLGLRLRGLRESNGLSLGELATRSGVSKAMIARIEKAQSSATAALLGRLCAGLGVRLSSVIDAADHAPERLSRRAEQSQWRDPETGYVRRLLSPAGARSGIVITLVELPRGARVPYEAWAANAYMQQLVMLDGALHLQLGEQCYELVAGDCIDFDVKRPNVFENRGKVSARYLVVIRR